MLPNPKARRKCTPAPSKENVWFTLIYGDALGKWDRETKKIQVWRVPTKNSMPYGLDIGPDDTPALAESAVPPMPEEEESSSSEQAGEESNSEEVLADDVSTESVSDQGPDPAEIAPEVEIAPGEESVALEEEPVALEDEPVSVDDDGPGIPMGRARRSKGSEKKVTETT